MAESKWSIFEDKRYDSEKQICPQCQRFNSKYMESDIGFCCFLNKPHSPHLLEWAVALSNIICNGFEFREVKS